MSVKLRRRYTARQKSAPRHATFIKSIPKSDSQKCSRYALDESALRLNHCAVMLKHECYRRALFVRVMIIEDWMDFQDWLDESPMNLCEILGFQPKGVATL